MHVTNAAGPTQGVTALPHSSPSSGNGQGLAIVTIEAQSPAPLTKSKNTFSPLPTPINVQRLQDALTNHPDQGFVSRLCNNFRYGADVGFTGRRISTFSRNLPSAVSQRSVVTENLSREVALGRVAGPFPSPPLPNFQVSPIGLVPKKHTANSFVFPKIG